MVAKMIRRIIRNCHHLSACMPDPTDGPGCSHSHWTRPLLPAEQEESCKAWCPANHGGHLGHMGQLLAESLQSHPTLPAA